MPQSLTMIQIHKITPVPSVLVITLMSLAYLTSSNIIQLMNYVGFATWLAIGVAVFCVIFLRFKHPDWERPIKVKSTSVNKAPNQTPFLASTAILENNFLIRPGYLFLNHLDVPLNYIQRFTRYKRLFEYASKVHMHNAIFKDGNT